MLFLKFVYWCARLLTRLAVTCTLFGGILIVLYTTFWLPDVSILADENPETTAFMERARESFRKDGNPAKIQHRFVPLGRISPYLVQAVRIAEDDRFYRHNGFDFTEIRNAVEENLRARRWVRGGSTITQQLAKNLYLSPEKTFRRKFDEMLLTWKLEHHLTKDRIFELYLNYVDWGNGCFGAESAARYYFLKPARRLTPREAANLAARLPNPGYLGSRAGESKRRARERMILARMKREGLGNSRREGLPREENVRNPIPTPKPTPHPAGRQSAPADWVADLGEKLSALGSTAQRQLTAWLIDRETISLDSNGGADRASTIPEKRSSKSERAEKPARQRALPEVFVEFPEQKEEPTRPATRHSGTDPSPSEKKAVGDSSPSPPTSHLSLLEGLSRLEKAWTDQP